MCRARQPPAALGIKISSPMGGHTSSWPSLDFKTCNNPYFSSSLMLFPSVNVTVGMQNDVGTQVPWVYLPCLHSMKLRSREQSTRLRSSVPAQTDHLAPDLHTGTQSDKIGRLLP